MKKILVFDVNETLLDLKSLDPLFEKIFGDSLVRQQWFGQFIHNAFLTIITDSYQPFGKIGMAALEMVAQRNGITLLEEDKVSIANGIKHLSPHLEVPEALMRLKTEGFCLVTLTNSTEEVVNAQIENAGLKNYFEKVFSADSVKKLKPAKEPYEFVAKQLNVATKDLMLIAAHAWDIAGALKAGCSAAFIARTGLVLNPLVSQPHIVGQDLGEVADKIIKSS